MIGEFGGRAVVFHRTLTYLRVGNKGGQIGSYKGAALRNELDGDFNLGTFELHLPPKVSGAGERIFSAAEA